MCILKELCHGNTLNWYLPLSGGVKGTGEKGLGEDFSGDEMEIQL